MLPTLKTMIPFILAVGLAATVGCSSDSNPTASAFADGDPSATETPPRGGPDIEDAIRLLNFPAQGRGDYYVARLLPVNDSDVRGVALIRVRGDEIMIGVTAVGMAPGIPHGQHIHAGGSCPGPGDDVNGDGFIDAEEGHSSVGEILVPLDSMIETQAGGDFPVANGGGRLRYMVTGSLSAMLADLNAPDPDPLDPIGKLDGESLDLGNRHIVLHGVDPGTQLPGTVGTIGGLPAHASLPVACGEIVQLSGPPSNAAFNNSNSNRPTTTFTVTIENVSGPGTVDTPVANGVVPLSPGVWAVFNGAANPAFKAGSDADVGTERIAEDGFIQMELESLQNDRKVAASGSFDAPGGAAGPPIEPGETSTFTVTASPGQRLTFETMFVQSNDYFYAFGGKGLKLFKGNTPISGDVTAEVRLWDAGTEVDEPLGGPNQKLQQDPTATDVGPDENETVRLVSETQTAFTVPPVSSVLRVTITPQP